MSKLLALLNPIRDYLYGAVIVALLGGFTAFTVHERHLGALHETKAVQAATAKAQAVADKVTAQLQAKADKAEEDYQNEHQNLIDYTSANPVGDVRLCVNPKPASLPKAAAKDGGDAGPVTASGDVLNVPAGDSAVRTDSGPNIGSLLGLLAGRADQVTAVAREMQSRP